MGCGGSVLPSSLKNGEALGNRVGLAVVVWSWQTYHGRTRCRARDQNTQQLEQDIPVPDPTPYPVPQAMKQDSYVVVGGVAVREDQTTISVCNRCRHNDRGGDKKKRVP